MNEKIGGCWPTEKQGWLLQAALRHDSYAVEAWNRWQNSTDFDNLDQGSLRLLPLLHRNLSKLGVEHPLMEGFRSVYRDTWVQNQVLFHRIADTLRIFHANGIEKTLLLKGAALTMFHYKDYGLRPMCDFDVLVPTDQFLDALRLLQAKKWISDIPGYSLADLLAIPIATNQQHAIGLHDSKGSGFDLHCHVLYNRLTDDADDEFWNSARIEQFNEIPIYVLNSTDQLLHTCIHGARWNSMPPWRWLADTVVIIKSSPDLDWDRLLFHAQKYRAILPVRNTLRYLYEQLGTHVPTDVLRRMEDVRVSRIESMEYRAITTPSSLLINRILNFGFRYRYRLTDTTNTNLLREVPGFIRYVKQRWGINHIWKVPMYAALKLQRPDTMRRSQSDTKE